MGAKLRSWWQNIRKPLDTIIITLLVVLLALFVVIILGYIFHWDWTGLNEFNSISITTNMASTPQKITRTIAFQPGKTLGLVATAHYSRRARCGGLFIQLHHQQK